MKKKEPEELSSKMAAYYKELQEILGQMPKWPDKKAFFPGGLRPNEVLLLRAVQIRQSGGEAPRITELSEMMWVTPAAATNLVTSLERLGYLKRERSPRDGRVVLVLLTDKGETCLKETERQHSEVLARMIGWLGEQDAGELIRLLGRIRDFMVAERKCPPGKVQQAPFETGSHS